MRVVYSVYIDEIWDLRQEKRDDVNEEEERDNVNEEEERDNVNEEELIVMLIWWW